MNKNINSEFYSIPSFLDSSTKITIATAIIYIIIAKLTQFIFIQEINLPPFFPAIGLAVATVMIFGRKAILGIAIGSFIFTGGLFQSDLQNATSFGEFLKPMLICFVRPLIACLNAFVVLYLSQWWCKNKYPFDKGINVLYFASACLLGSIISVSIGIIPLVVTSSIHLDNLILIWSNWFRGNALGAILFAPLVLSWVQKTNKSIKWSLSKKIEALILTIVTVVFSLLIFKTSANNESIVYFILLWAAYRFETKVVSIIFIIISLIAIYCTGNQQGGFISNGWNSDFLMLQLFLFVNMVSILFLKAIIQEKEQYKLEISEEKLNFEKNILEAIIESPNEISIYSLDKKLNYLAFNSTHKNNMRDQYGVEIKKGTNLIDCIIDPIEKENYINAFYSVLKGNTHNEERKTRKGEYWDIITSPIKDTENKIIGTTTVSSNITSLRLSKFELEKNNYNLNERIKEISCLHNIFEINNNDSLSLTELFNACVKLIPEAFQSPEITNCKIILQNKEFIARKDQKTNWSLDKTIMVNDTEYGTIKIGFFEKSEFNKEFLEEEVQLLEVISKILSQSLERNLALDNLRKSENDYRVLFENVQDVFFKTSIESKIIMDVSPSCSNFNGVTREELIGQPMSFIYPDKELMKSMFEKALTEGELFDFNNVIQIKGKNYNVSISAKVVCDENGLPSVVVGSLRDISQRKLAEEKLKESEEDYRNLFENVQDVFFKSDLKTETILNISPSCIQFNGITREELIGKNMFFIYPDQSELEIMLEKLFKEQKLTDYNNKILINGKLFHVSISAKILFDSNGEPEFVIGSMRDITERWKAEENLKINEEKFRSIYENLEDVYFKKDLEGFILDITPSVEKHFYLKREEVIGLNSFDFYLDPEVGKKFYEIVLRDQYVNDYEECFINARGENVYFSVNAKLRYDINGKIAFIEGTMRNINERINNQKQLQQATERIKESEAKFRSIYENMQDVYYSHELDGKILDMSPSVEKHFKYTTKDVKELYVKDFYNDLSVYEEQKNIMIQNGSLNDEEAEFVTADGELVYFSFNSKIIYDSNGEPLRVEGTMRNVNERIINQKKLLEATDKTKESEAKYRSIYENFEDIYFKTQIDGTIIDVSPSFEKNFKMECSKVIKKSVHGLYYDTQDREKLLDKLKTDGQISDFDARFKDADGSILFFSMNARLLYNEKGDPIYIEGSMHNINERVAIQKEMLAKNRTLEFQNTELEQFAYIASHDLQEPLITVIHSIKMLEEEIGETLDEDQKQYLQFINSSTSRMQLLVKGLLDYSRIGKERKSHSIDCNEIVANVLEDMSSSLKESGAIIEYENLPIIEGNRTEVRQLFQNMISNANKYRKKDRQAKIKIAAIKEEKNWQFSVEDNGIGIEEQDIDKIFVIFKRLHNRDQYQGTGIGLSHCKKIVEHHKGKIWVESKHNEGSTFKWTFPIEQN